MTRNLSLFRPARAMAVLVTLVVAVSACGSGGGGSSGSTAASGQKAQVALRFGQAPGSITNLVYWVAIGEGFLKEQGFEVTEYHPGTGLDAAELAAVEGNSLDLFNDSVSFFANASQKGVTMTVTGPFTKSDTYVVVPPNSSIPIAGKNGATWEDTLRALKGKKLGVPALGGAVANNLGVLLKRVGIDPQKDLTEVAVPASSAALAVIQSGQVDADYTVVTVANLAQTQGLGQTALDLMKNGPSDFAAASLSGGAMRSEWLKGGSGDQEKRYHQAMVDAVDFLYKPENLDELVSLAKKNGVGGTDDQITSTLKLAIDAKAYSATVSKDDLSGALSFAQSAGVIAASPKIDLSTFATSTAVK